MSNYRTHAINEFKAAGWIDEWGDFKDEMQGAICNHVLKLLEVFEGEGHSGFSAPYAIDLFAKLAAFEPVVPITGEDWEWVGVADHLLQNKRCGHLFKDPMRFDGQAYDINGKVFWEWFKGEDGEVYKSHYTNHESAVPIEFPYTPTIEYVFVPNEEFPNEVL